MAPIPTVVEDAPGSATGEGFLVGWTVGEIGLETIIVGEGVGEMVDVGFCEPVIPTVGVGVFVAIGEGACVGLCVGDGVAVARTVGASVADGVAVWLT